MSGVGEEKLDFVGIGDKYTPLNFEDIDGYGEKKEESETR